MDGQEGKRDICCARSVLRREGSMSRPTKLMCTTENPYDESSLPFDTCSSETAAAVESKDSISGRSEDQISADQGFSSCSSCSRINLAPFDCS